MNIYLKITEAYSVNSYICKQALSTLASCLITLCCGLMFGITAVMLPQLRVDKSIQYDPSQESWIASISALSMIVGSLSGGQVSDSCGRKLAHIILGIPLIIGWCCIACANSTNLILVGRLITGLSTGANMPVSLVYIGEITNPKFRTAALFLPGLTGHVGVLFSHIIGYYLNWKVSAIICTVPAALSCIIFLFLKESPLWLIAKGRTEEGIESYRWFRGTDDASEEALKILLQRQTEKPKMSIRESLKTISSKAFIKPMLLLMVLMLNVQFSGVNIVIFYSQDIFEQMFSGNVDAFMLMIAMDCIRGAISVAIFLLGKYVPKKIALLTSTFGVSLFILGLVTTFIIKLDNLWPSILCLVMYIGCSSAVVTIGWTFVPELLPSNARGLGSGINAAYSFLLMFFMVKITPDFRSAYGDSAFFGLFGVVTFACAIVLSFTLPETNGRTLQSIEDSYNKNKVEQTVL